MTPPVLFAIDGARLAGKREQHQPLMCREPFPQRDVVGALGIQELRQGTVDVWSGKYG